MPKISEEKGKRIMKSGTTDRTEVLSSFSSFTFLTRMSFFFVFRFRLLSFHYHYSLWVYVFLTFVCLDSSFILLGWSRKLRIDRLRVGSLTLNLSDDGTTHFAFGNAWRSFTARSIFDFVALVNCQFAHSLLNAKHAQAGEQIKTVFEMSRWFNFCRLNESSPSFEQKLNTLALFCAFPSHISCRVLSGHDLHVSQANVNVRNVCHF